MSNKELYQQLSLLLDPVGLCSYLGEKTRYGKKPSKGFTVLHAYLKSYAPQADVQEVERLLNELGCYDDVEIGLNLCAIIDELEDEE